MITQVSNTISTLKNLWIEIFLDKTTKVTNIADGSVLNAVAFGCAKVAQKAIKDIAITEAKIFPETATGEYLDRSAALFGVSPRKGALGSSTYVRVYAEPGTVYDETCFFVNQNGIRFSVDEAVTVGRSGYAYVKVRSVNQGQVTNVDANSIVNVTPEPQGHIECTNEYMATGGRDSEDDETFRIRIKTNLNILSKGTLEYYTQVFQNIDDRVLKVMNVGLGEDGIFYLYIVSQNGISFTDAELDELLEKSKDYFGLFELNLQGDIVGIALKNAEWFYIGSERGIDFRAEIDPSYEVADVRKNIQVALTKYLDFRFWDAGKVVEWDDLLEIVKNAEGVKYVPDEYFFPYYDQEVPLNQLPRIRGFVMRDLEGNVLYDAGSDLSPLFYPAEEEDLFQGLNDTSLALRQPAYFTVTDENGDPLAGARVTVGGSSVLTDSSGRATISLVNGSYTYSIVLDKYKTTQGQFVVLNAPIYIGASLELAPFEIVFMVEAEDGKPIEGAVISIAGTTLTTNINGEASIEVKNGSYPYSITALGFNSLLNESVVVQDTDMYVPVTMYYHEWVQTIYVRSMTTSEAISGVLVEVNGNEYVTDEDGKVTINLINGQYLLKLSKPGFVDTQALITVQNMDETRTIEMDLYKYNVNITITELQSGTPIPNVLVTLSNGLSGRTNAQGVVTFKMTNGNYTGSATNPTYDDLSINFNVEASDLNLSYQMDFRHYEVILTVLEQRTNDPVENAVVTIGTEVLTTNAQGVVTASLQNGTYPYTVTKLGYYDYEDSITVQDNNVSDVARLTDYPWEVTFSVRDGIDPIQGAVVSVNGNQYTTNEQGLVTTTLINGTYDYEVTRLGYADVNSSLTVNNSELAVDVPMILRPWDVLFIVYNSNGLPVQGASVTVEGISVETNVAGMATIGLTNGPHQYEIEAEEYQVKTGSVVVDNSDMSVQVTLDPVLYDVTFIVKDKATPPNLVQDAVVSGNNQSKLTDAQGEAVLQFPKGEWNVSITKSNYVSNTTSIEVTGDMTVEVSIDQLFLLDFIVRDTEGTVLSNAEVVISGPAIVGSPVTLRTDDTGHTPQTSVINGSFHWGASFPDYSSEEGDDTIENANKTVEITLEEGRGIVFIVQGEDSSPIEGATILVDNTNSFQTNVDGEVEVDLSPGQHSYRVTLDTYQTVTGSVQVVDGQSQEVNITLVHGGELTLNIKDGMANLTGATVTIKNSSGGTVKTGTTDSNGNISVDVPNGDYTYEVDASGYKSKDDGAVTISSADKTEEVQMTNYKFWTLTFNVKYKTTNLNGASVKITNVTNLGETKMYTGTTNSSGVLTIAASAANEVTLNGTINYTVTLNGYESFSGSTTILNANRTVDVSLEKYSTVTFSFVDYTGSAVTPNGGGSAVAKVSLASNDGGGTRTADVSGTSVTFSNVLDGSYTYTFTPANGTPYQSQSGTITVNGANVTRQLTLVSIVSVTVTVRDDASVALQGATVTVNGASKGTTNSSGQITFTQQSSTLPITIAASLSDYRSSSQQVSVGLDDVTVNLTLQYLVLVSYSIRLNTASGTDLLSQGMPLYLDGSQTDMNHTGFFTTTPGEHTLSVQIGYVNPADVGASALKSFTPVDINIPRTSHDYDAGTLIVIGQYVFNVVLTRVGVFYQEQVSVSLDGVPKGDPTASGKVEMLADYGSHVIAVEGGDYNEAYSNTYMISSKADINIALTPLYTAQWSVEDASGTAVSGATITYSGVKSGTATTDSSGNATLTKCKAGSLSYTVAAAGFTTSSSATMNLTGMGYYGRAYVTLSKAEKLVQITTPVGSRGDMQSIYEENVGDFTLIDLLIVGGGSRGVNCSNTADKLLTGGEGGCSGGYFFGTDGSIELLEMNVMQNGAHYSIAPGSNGTETTVGQTYVRRGVGVPPPFWGLAYSAPNWNGSRQTGYKGPVASQIKSAAGRGGGEAFDLASVMIFNDGNYTGVGGNTGACCFGINTLSPTFSYYVNNGNGGGVAADGTSLSFGFNFSSPGNGADTKTGGIVTQLPWKGADGSYHDAYSAGTSQNVSIPFVALGGTGGGGFNRAVDGIGGKPNGGIFGGGGAGGYGDGGDGAAGFIDAPGSDYTVLNATDGGYGAGGGGGVLIYNNGSTTKGESGDGGQGIIVIRFHN